MFHWWRGPRGLRHGMPEGAPHARMHGGPHGGPHGRGGRRRPLRFLIEHLGLDDTQAATLSRLFESLRLEREQAGLDLRRAKSKVADLFEAQDLDTAALDAAADARVAAAKRERDAIVEVVTKLHALLNDDQRKRLSVLLRSGPLDL